VGVAIFIAGGGLRLWPVFVLRDQFSGCNCTTGHRYSELGLPFAPCSIMRSCYVSDHRHQAWAL
jgi:hypothetical protein